MERWKDAAHGQEEGDVKEEEDRKAGERAVWKERKKRRRKEKVRRVCRWQRRGEGCTWR